MSDFNLATIATMKMPRRSCDFRGDFLRLWQRLPKRLWRDYEFGIFGCDFATMAHDMGALRGFSALAQKHGGESGRNRGCLWRIVGCRPCPAAAGRTPEGTESAQTGEKMRGHPGISGAAIGAIAGAEHPTRRTKRRAALRDVHTCPFLACSDA